MYDTNEQLNNHEPVTPVEPYFDSTVDTEQKNNVDPETPEVNLSPILDDQDLPNSELYETDWATQNHEIRQSPNGPDLVSSAGNFIGINIAAGESMNASAYYAAVYDAQETGRGIWPSSDDTHLYATLIVRNAEGTYDWHAFKLDRALLEIKPETIEEPLLENEPVIESIPETPVIETTQPPIPSENPTVKIFTQVDFRAALEREQITITEIIPAVFEDTTLEVATHEIPDVKNSDVGDSVENIVIANDQKIENTDLPRVTVIAAELEVFQPIATSATPESIQTTESVIAATVNTEMESSRPVLNPIVFEAPIAANIERLSSVKPESAIQSIDLPTEFTANINEAVTEVLPEFEEDQAKDEKNEPLISSITNEIETIDVVIPVVIEKKRLDEDQNSEVVSAVAVVESIPATNFTAEIPVFADIEDFDTEEVAPFIIEAKKDEDKKTEAPASVVIKNNTPKTGEVGAIESLDDEITEASHLSEQTTPEVIHNPIADNTQVEQAPQTKPQAIEVRIQEAVEAITPIPENPPTLPELMGSEQSQLERATGISLVKAPITIEQTTPEAKVFNAERKRLSENSSGDTVSLDIARSGIRIIRSPEAKAPRARVFGVQPAPVVQTTIRTQRPIAQVNPPTAIKLAA